LRAALSRQLIRGSPARRPADAGNVTISDRLAGMGGCPSSFLYRHVELSSWQRSRGCAPILSSSRFRDRTFLRVKHMTINKSLASSSLAEVIDRILDKGIVVDAFVRIALVGIELIAIEIRVVVASVETYLRYAEAVGLTTDPLAAA
jgi:hypothetical protein